MRRLRDIKSHISFAADKADTEEVENVTMLEGFEWYSPNDHFHWKRLQKAIPELKAIGIDNIWIPPGCKAGWQGSNGYDLYDLYDLGEFDQKGSRATKWGTKDDLMTLMKIARAVGVGIYWDAVLNHKAAADYTEKCHAIKVSQEDRTAEIGDVHEIEVWTGYDFSGRQEKYSDMKYHWNHFSGTNYEARLRSGDSIYKFIGTQKPGWAKDVDDEDGNADYLMFNDLDFSQEEVCQDVCHWGQWIASTLGLSGFRLDAVKHFSANFLKLWINHLDQTLGQKLFMVGEYWRGDSDVLGRMIERFDGRLHLFDVALAGKFSEYSRTPQADMRTILHGTLVESHPENAVTFVVNHDTQERFERDHEVTPVDSWFVPLAYAFILLRQNCGYPCAFYGDLYGTQGPKPKPPTCLGKLPVLLSARKLYAYGAQMDYLDEAHCIGFTRLGNPFFNDGAGLAVIMSNAHTFRFKKMYVGESHAGESWTDVLQFAWGSVAIDHKGWGLFPVGPRSVGVWVNSKARGRERLDKIKFNDDIYNQTPGPIVVVP